ncbi:MAG: sigma-54 dependent transcriptional regulator [Desulfobacteraceae bacterium]|nr:sigma-54 dependent transcriptional regulator [Desulfobacteraceae bacterium]
MPRHSPLILVADDDRAHRLMLTTLLAGWGYRVEEAEDGLKTLELIRAHSADLILMDMRMPVMDGLQATREILSYNPAIPILVMTAYSSIPTAVEALKSGAFDYITKPLDFDSLRLSIGRALEHTRLREENEGLKSQLPLLHSEMIGKSPPVLKLIEMIRLVAPSEATVLITGESGTGKGLVARAIHENSPRREKPLIAVNCGAIPETLIESELFGHEKGAFTGADRVRPGRFQAAHGGTLFLDEIGDLPLLMQAKLLRVLQEGEIQRVGSDRSIPVDVRVIAATNRDIRKMATEGGFREDLYYRLNVISVDAPPLREREEDIPALAQHFWTHFARKNRKNVKGITPRAMDMLLKYSWPGNVRELENTMERAIILLQGEYVSEKELPLAIQGPDCACPEDEPFDGAQIGTLEDMERAMISRIMKEVSGNKSEAARRLGITRRTLKLKLKRFGEDSEDPRES